MNRVVKNMKVVVVKDLIEYPRTIILYGLPLFALSIFLGGIFLPNWASPRWDFTTTVAVYMGLYSLGTLIVFRIEK